jgi:hypothetical protein
VSKNAFCHGCFIFNITSAKIQKCFESANNRMSKKIFLGFQGAGVAANDDRMNAWQGKQAATPTVST